MELIRKPSSTAGAEACVWLFISGLPVGSSVTCVPPPSGWSQDHYAGKLNTQIGCLKWRANGKVWPNVADQREAREGSCMGAVNLDIKHIKFCLTLPVIGLFFLHSLPSSDYLAWALRISSFVVTLACVPFCLQVCSLVTFPVHFLYYPDILDSLPLDFTLFKSISLP